MTANGDGARRYGSPRRERRRADRTGSGTGEANDLTQAIGDARTTSWIGALYLYSYQDDGTSTSTDEDWFGLLNVGGAEKPAYAAVANALAG